MVSEERIALLLFASLFFPHSLDVRVCSPLQVHHLEPIHRSTYHLMTHFLSPFEKHCV